MKVRRATREDLPQLVAFTTAEAQEAEGRIEVLESVEEGIRMALQDDSIAMYWMLVDELDVPIGSVSALREWSDWNAGFYWWIQSMYITPNQRGRGYMSLLLKAVVDEMIRHKGLELRLYVHKDNRRAIRAYEKASFERSPYEIMILRDKMT